MENTEVIEEGLGLEGNEKGSENGHNHSTLEAMNAGPGFKAWVQKIFWHGGSVYDAWFNAVEGQVGQVILSMPYSYSQMGFGLGIFFHFLYAAIGIWTCYMLACLYLEYRSRKEKEGADFKRHVIQYHEVMGHLVGDWLRKVSLFFNVVTMGCVATVQIIACASNAYYLNTKYNKREWAIIFGAMSMLTCLLPSFHNFRVWSIMGTITTTYTAWYMLAPASFMAREIMHAMWRPKSYKYVYLCTVAYVMTITMPHCIILYRNFGDVLLTHSNALSVLPRTIFRDIALCFMIIHQAVAFGMYVMPLNFMWEKVLGVHSSKYLIRVICRLPVSILLWFLALLVPFFGPLNSMIGSLIMSFSVFIIPCFAYIKVFSTKSSRQDAAEKLASWLPGWNGILTINIGIIVFIGVLGFCFGSWASISNIAQQFSSFGFFEKCYQCDTVKK